jgi:transposase
VFAGQPFDGLAWRQRPAAWFRVIAERRPGATCPDCGRPFEVRAPHGLELLSGGLPASGMYSA